jgi:hypothetical protein
VGGPGAEGDGYAQVEHQVAEKEGPALLHERLGHAEAVHGADHQGVPVPEIDHAPRGEPAHGFPLQHVLEPAAVDHGCVPDAGDEVAREGELVAPAPGPQIAVHAAQADRVHPPVHLGEQAFEARRVAVGADAPDLERLPAEAGGGGLVSA